MKNLRHPYCSLKLNNTNLLSPASAGLTLAVSVNVIDAMIIPLSNSQATSKEVE
jgi:hypothetical protein